MERLRQGAITEKALPLCSAHLILYGGITCSISSEENFSVFEPIHIGTDIPKPD